MIRVCTISLNQLLIVSMCRVTIYLLTSYLMDRILVLQELILFQLQIVRQKVRIWVPILVVYKCVCIYNTISYIATQSTKLLHC